MKSLLLSAVFLTFLHINKVDGQPNYPQNPKDAVLITSDLQNFITAFKSLSEKNDSVQVLQTLYLDKASPGLKEYITRFSLTAESIHKAIQKHGKAYKKIERFYNNISIFQGEYVQELEVYKKAIPNAVFPPTYLLVADYQGIGQASKLGQLVSIEKKAVNDYEALKNITLHELSHFQQAISMGIEKYTGMYGRSNNMLDFILREGGAEFITYNLVRNKVNQFKRLKYYEKHELALWDRFLVDLKNQDKTFWITVPSEIDSTGNPGMPGYSLGYKIIEAFYNQAEDKMKALDEILNIDDANAFFEKSGYHPKKQK